MSSPEAACFSWRSFAPPCMSSGADGKLWRSRVDVPEDADQRLAS
jgi:hypothetical protein